LALKGASLDESGDGFHWVVVLLLLFAYRSVMI